MARLGQVKFSYFMLVSMRLGKEKLQDNFSVSILFQEKDAKSQGVGAALKVETAKSAAKVKHSARLD